jgi:hypothetical protein
MHSLSSLPAGHVRLAHPEPHAVRGTRMRPRRCLPNRFTIATLEGLDAQAITCTCGAS